MVFSEKVEIKMKGNDNRWPNEKGTMGKNIITLNKVRLLVKALHTNNQKHEKSDTGWKELQLRASGWCSCRWKVITFFHSINIISFYYPFLPFSHKCFRICRILNDSSPYSGHDIFPPVLSCFKEIPHGGTKKEDKKRKKKIKGSNKNKKEKKKESVGVVAGGLVICKNKNKTLKFTKQKPSKNSLLTRHRLNN